MHDEADGWTPSLEDVQASSLLLEARPVALRYVRIDHVRETGEPHADYYAARPQVGFGHCRDLPATESGIQEDSLSDFTASSLPFSWPPRPMLTVSNSALRDTPYSFWLPLCSKSNESASALSYMTLRTLNV